MGGSLEVPGLPTTGTMGVPSSRIRDRLSFSPLLIDTHIFRLNSYEFFVTIFLVFKKD